MSSSGTIKNFFQEKGFGFVTPDDGGDDVFVHVKENPELESCQQGDAVYYDAEWDDRKGKYKGTNLSAAIVGFVRRVREYRGQAKAGALSAPPALAIAGASSPRATSLQWFVIDDQVMGGRSHSALLATDAGLEFAGVINTTGGGFSSCRTLGDEEPLGFPTDAKFIELRAVGDGHLYKLSLHTADSWAMSVPSWAHDFHAAPPDKEATWRLPLRDFVPLRQGRPVQGATLDPANITGLGVSLSLYDMRGQPNPHFGDGPFKVTLKSLAVRS